MNFYCVLAEIYETHYNQTTTFLLQQYMKRSVASLFLNLISFFILSLVACEREIKIDLPDSQPRIVVEGYIESDTFPVVILTKSLTYLQPINLGDLGSTFIKGAKVSVIVDGKDTFALSEFVLPVQDSTRTPFSFYVNPFLKGRIGSSYLLEVEAEGYAKVSAYTTLQAPVAIDSFTFEKVDSANSIFLPENYDSLYRLLAYFKDPAGESNYYHYWTSRNSMRKSYQNTLSPFTENDNSVFKLDFFDGKYVSGAWIQGSKPRGDSTKNSRYFRLGDTVAVKWGSIDRAQYTFWDTYQNNLQGGGPFSPPIVVKSNVKGGYGVWAGTGVKYYRNLIVK